MFFGGAAVFTVGSAMAFASGSPGLLIAAQAIMGIGGAAVLPSSLSIVSHTFSDPHERTGAISVWASCSGLGLAIGPLVTGVLLDHFSWHSAYLINVVIGGLAVILTPLLVAESKHPTRRLDPVGILLGTIAVASATYAIIEGASVGYTSALIDAMYAVFAVSLTAFLFAESRHHDPMLDLRLFRSRSYSVVMSVATATMFGFVGISLMAVLYMEQVQHLSALATGVRLLAMFATYIVVSAFAGRIVARVGFTAALTAGLLVAGGGSALLVAPSTAAAVNSVPALQAGMASASVNMFRQLGSVLGPSVLGTIVTTRFPRCLEQRLSSAGVPSPTAAQITARAVHGETAHALPPSLAGVVADSAARAFTDATHVGLLAAGIVLLVVALPVVAFVRHRNA